MKKVELKSIIQSIGKEKKAYHYSTDDGVYLSESHFIIRFDDKKYAQYVIDEVSKKKKKPEWSELPLLENFYKDIKGDFCSDISEEELKDGREILFLKTDDLKVKINKKFTVPGGTFYINGKTQPVYEFVDGATLMILPINWSAT